MLGIQHQSYGEGNGSPGRDISQWKISHKDLNLIPSIHQKRGREAEAETGREREREEKQRTQFTKCPKGL